MKIQEEEASTLLSVSENNSISNNQIHNPNKYCLDLQRTSKSQETRIMRKGLSPTSLLNTKY
jgi:hypothetical protein